MREAEHLSAITRPMFVRDELVAAHTGCARRIALRMARRCPAWVPREDLVGAGLVGLIEAAERFDATRLLPFLAFATPRIRGAVGDELRRGDPMPRRVRQAARRVGHVIHGHERRYGTTPDDAVVAAALGVTVAHYRDRLAPLADVAVGPLDEAVLARAAATGADPAELATRREAITQVRAALAELSQRDAIVLSLHYTEELSYAEIGGLLGVTPSRVGQLHTRALAAVRAALARPAQVKIARASR